MPNAAALASEYVPRRQRPFAVTLTIVCIPLGGVRGGAPRRARSFRVYGWRPLFMAGGAVPIVLGVLLFFVLPESPRYLAGRRERWPELTAHAAAHGTRRSGRRRPTWRATAAAAQAACDARRDLRAARICATRIALFASFFFCLMVNYIGILLIPVGLHRVRASRRPTANRVLRALQLRRRRRRASSARSSSSSLGSRVAMLGHVGGWPSWSRWRLRGMTVRGTGVVAADDADDPRRCAAERRADDDVRAGGARVSHRDPRHRRRRGGRLRPHRQRAGGAASATGRSIVGGNPGYFTSWAITMGIVAAGAVGDDAAHSAERDLGAPAKVR